MWARRQSIQVDQARLAELVKVVNKHGLDQKKAEAKVARLKEQLHILERFTAGNQKRINNGKEQVGWLPALLLRLHSQSC